MEVFISTAELNEGSDVVLQNYNMLFEKKSLKHHLFFFFSALENPWKRKTWPTGGLSSHRLWRYSTSSTTLHCSSAHNLRSGVQFSLQLLSVGVRTSTWVLCRPHLAQPAVWNWLRVSLQPAWAALCVAPSLGDPAASGRRSARRFPHDSRCRVSSRWRLFSPWPLQTLWFYQKCFHAVLFENVRALRLWRI